jgi:hypothetical protein
MDGLISYTWMVYGQTRAIESDDPSSVGVVVYNLAEYAALSVIGEIFASCGAQRAESEQACD